MISLYFLDRESKIKWDSRGADTFFTSYENVSCSFFLKVGEIIGDEVEMVGGS